LEDCTSVPSRLPSDISSTPCLSSRMRICCQTSFNAPFLRQKLSRRQHELYPWAQIEAGISCQRQPVLRTNNTPLSNSLLGITDFVRATGVGSFAANQSYCVCEMKNVACFMRSTSLFRQQKGYSVL
jgi:hypothetical protein